MQNNTKTGLLLLIIGSIIGIISNIIFAVNQSSLNFLSSIGAIGGLMSFIGIIFLIMGRKEFGERHRKFVIIAIVLFVLSIVIPVIIVAASVFVYVTQSMSAGDIDLSFVRNIFYIIPIASIIGSIAYFLLLYELENKIGKIVLVIAIVTSAAISGVLAVSIGEAFEDSFGSIDYENLEPTEYSEITSEFSQKISTSGFYGLINGALMIIALYIPYQRISSGELVPESDKSKIKEADRICPNCGKEIPIDANTCPYCSKKFENYL